MSEQRRTTTEYGPDPGLGLVARERQQCQAAGLRGLARLVESDVAVSASLADGLRHLSIHLVGAERVSEVEHCAVAALWCGAVLESWPSSRGYASAYLRWSDYFGVRVQCDVAPEAPSPGVSEQAR